MSRRTSVSRPPKALRLGSDFPNLSCSSTYGPINSTHSHFGDSWLLFVTVPTAFHPVATTELAELERLRGEFESRNVKLCVLCSGGGDVAKWLVDVHAATGYTVNYPVLCDDDYEVSRGVLGLIEDEHPDLLRCLYIVDPNKKIRVMQNYPQSMGFSSFEILRCIDAQMRRDLELQTPANWISGRDCYLEPSLTGEEATSRFVRGVRCVTVPSEKRYLRLTPDPLAEPQKNTNGGRRRSSTVSTASAAKDADVSTTTGGSNISQALGSPKVMREQHSTHPAASQGNAVNRDSRSDVSRSDVEEDEEEEKPTSLNDRHKVSSAVLGI